MIGYAEREERVKKAIAVIRADVESTRDGKERIVRKATLDLVEEAVLALVRIAAYTSRS